MLTLVRIAHTCCHMSTYVHQRGWPVFPFYIYTAYTCTALTNSSRNAGLQTCNREFTISGSSASAKFSESVEEHQLIRQQNRGESNAAQCRQDQVRYVHVGISAAADLYQTKIISLLGTVRRDTAGPAGKQKSFSDSRSVTVTQTEALVIITNVTYTRPPNIRWG